LKYLININIIQKKRKRNIPSLLAPAMS